MDVREFNIETDLAVLHNWLKYRKINHLPQADEIPAIGFVVYTKHTPIAMCFLRRIEGNYGKLDGLTNNPLAPGEVRDKANDFVVNTIINKAKELKLKSIIAFSDHKSTVVRSRKHGFVQLDHVFIVRDLSN